MKQVILKSITLTNFKGEKERTTAFNSDVTTIKGANGLGKSRHFDAFIWLLFGKDSADRKDYEIKTRVNGQELHNVDATVSAIIIVNGEEITLKRSLVEEWVKPRGKAERVFKGNRTDCWWNDVPVNVTEYAKRVSSIIDESLFKMLINPAFFVNMDMQLRRDTLFSLEQTLTDAEIVEKSPEFATLLDKISGKSLSDFKREIAAKKRLLKQNLAEISPRIDQTTKMKPAADDFAAIEKRIAEIDADIAAVDGQIADITKAIRAAYEEERRKADEVNALKSEKQKLVFNAQSNENDAAFRANQSRRELAVEIRSKKNELDSVRRSINTLENEKAEKEKTAQYVEVKISDGRKSWGVENAKTYDGSDICPVCHQELPEDAKAAAREKFNASKNAILASITRDGKANVERLNALKADLAAIDAKLKETRGAEADLDAEIKAKEADLAAIVETKARTITEADVPECAEIDKKISAIEATMSNGNAGSPDTSALSQKKADLGVEKENCVKRLAARDAIAKADAEIQRLAQEEKRLAQEIADIEGEEIAIQDFIRVKIEECESRINSHFHFVKFKLYDTTIEGNIYEVCTPLCDGIPYWSANSASQVNAGLDIINTLCKHFDVCAPIFIDNRESVNELIPTDSQIINLVVTRDKEIIVE